MGFFWLLGVTWKINISIYTTSQKFLHDTGLYLNSSIFAKPWKSIEFKYERPNILFYYMEKVCDSACLTPYYSNWLYGDGMDKFHAVI